MMRYSKFGPPFKSLMYALRKNGLYQLFLYLSNLDTYRFIESQKIVEFINGNNPPEFILDLGSGYSILPEVIQAYTGSAIVCLDLSEGAVQFQLNPRKNISAIQADMCSLPFESSSVPMITAISSIEHVPQDTQVFREIGRILEPDGKAIISVPFSANLAQVQNLRHSALLMRLLYKFKRFWIFTIGKKNTDYFISQTATDSIMKLYNRRELERILTESNLVIEKEYLLIGKPLLTGFHKLLPPGWFVLKDITFGLTLTFLGDKLFNNDNNAVCVIMQLSKGKPNAVC